jgi:hypothetical protein
MPIGHDMLIPPSDCEVEQRLIQFSQFRPLKSICGHLGLFGVDPELLARCVPVRMNGRSRLTTSSFRTLKLYSQH